MVTFVADINNQSAQMKKISNPFITFGYESSEYFCDRRNETSTLVRLLTNGNHVALISPRRMGKTGLLHHCFRQTELAENYHTFLIDIYATKSLSDMVFQMGRAIVKELRPWGQTAVDKFLQVVTSLRTGIPFDGQGNASWNLEVGDVSSPEFTLDEIFAYLQSSDKPCIVAIDEFQTIADYPENNVEAMLRTYVQECRNAVFVFSGSHRRMMNEMFSSPARPFYQSVTLMNISSIPLDEYIKFATHHFESNGKSIDADVIKNIYERFDATTWYIQKMFNELYSLTPKGDVCTDADVEAAIDNIICSYEPTYQDLLVQLSVRQVALLRAVCKEGKVQQITSGAFIKRHHLATASSVQKSKLTLLDRQIITERNNIIEPYDKFMALWIRKNL